MKIEYINKKALFNYTIIEKINTGMILTGSEVKSIRINGITFGDSYCYFNDINQLVIKNLHISEYKNSSYNNHEPLRERILLLNKKEINNIKSDLYEKRLTLIPIKLYNNEHNIFKLEIALCKGKKQHDKRDSLKEKDIKREIDRNNY